MSPRKTNELDDIENEWEDNNEDELSETEEEFKGLNEEDEEEDF